jgi:hypothetical protein
MSVFYDHMRVICIDFNGTSVRAVRYRDGDTRDFDNNCTSDPSDPNPFVATSDYTVITNPSGGFNERGVLLGRSVIGNSANDKKAIHVIVAAHGDANSIGYLTGIGGGSAYYKEVNAKIFQSPTGYHAISGVSSLTSGGGVYMMSQYQNNSTYTQRLDDMVIGIYGYE